MHELSLAASILRILEDAALAQAFRRVRTLHLCVPALAGVEIDALRFALDSLAPGTILEGADLVVDRPPGRALCAQCGEEVQVEELGEACPRCGAWRLRTAGATEMRVVDLLVE